MAIQEGVMTGALGAGIAYVADRFVLGSSGTNGAGWDRNIACAATVGASVVVAEVLHYGIDQQYKAAGTSFLDQIPGGTIVVGASLSGGAVIGLDKFLPQFGNPEEPMQTAFLKGAVSSALARSAYSSVYSGPPTVLPWGSSK